MAESISSTSSSVASSTRPGQDMQHNSLNGSTSQNGHAQSNFKLFPENKSSNNNIDRHWYLENCLFVANLSHRLSNAQLAWSLYDTFMPFGAIKSIKASRDPFGRPFGFVEFYQADPCAAALDQAQANPLQVAGRPLRLERAKRQCKLLIKNPWAGEREQQKLKSTLKGQRVSLLTDGLGLSAIVRLENPESAKERYKEWSKVLPGEEGWQISWIGGEEVSASSIRSSGLVHLVFPEDYAAAITTNTTNDNGAQQPFYYFNNTPLIMMNKVILFCTFK